MNIAHLDSLSRWTRFRPSLCDGCWSACCRLPLEATAADLVRLGVLSEDEIEDSLKKAARRLMAEGIVRQFRVTTGIFQMAQTPAGDCIYLSKERLCTVYEKRPEVCRRFPQVGPRPGFCPAMKRP